MKRFIFTITMIISILFSCNAQEIVKNEVDEFTGNRVIETSWEKLAWGLGVPSGIYTRIRSINGNMLLDMKYMIGSACVIGKDNKLMIMDENGKVHDLIPTDIFYGTKGGGSIGLAGSAGIGVFAHYYGNLDFLENNKITKMRIYTSTGYYDKEIKKKYQETLQKLYKLVIKESITR